LDGGGSYDESAGAGAGILVGLVIWVALLGAFIARGVEKESAGGVARGDDPNGSELDERPGKGDSREIHSRIAGFIDQ
jgi:hypothetical protein